MTLGLPSRTLPNQSPPHRRRKKRGEARVAPSMQRDLAPEMADLALQLRDAGHLEHLVSLALQGLGVERFELLLRPEPVQGGELAAAGSLLFEAGLGFFFGGGGVARAACDGLVALHGRGGAGGNELLSRSDRRLGDLVFSLPLGRRSRGTVEAGHRLDGWRQGQWRHGWGGVDKRL